MEALGTFVDLVLIVPLWNWNYAAQMAQLMTEKGSNRTFMELKLLMRLYGVSLQQVLIVPLWNWNEFDALGYELNPNVLIVPLWNWNKYSIPEVEI